MRKSEEQSLLEEMKEHGNKIKGLKNEIALRQKNYKVLADKVAALRCPFKTGQTVKNKKTGEKIFIESIEFLWFFSSQRHGNEFAGAISYRKYKKNGELYKNPSFDQGSIYHHTEEWEIVKENGE